MPYRDDLIRLYASNRVDQIRNVPAFQTLCQQYAGDSHFRAERSRIEEAKTFVEEYLDERPLTQQETVQKAIELLVSLRADPKNRDLCHELVVAGYRPSWSAERQQYFDEAWEQIKLEYDFFLSFTCRYPNVAGDNPVNTAYKQFIIAEIGIDEYKKADRKKTNLLALAVHRNLSQPGIKGFYFPHSQYDNTLTQRKLEEACDSCMVFVQLVQTIMFIPPAAGRGTNYCFFEWGRACARFPGRAREKNILYVVASPDRAAFLGVLPHAGYNNWHQDVRDRDPPYLPEVPFRDQASVKGIKNAFETLIVPQVRGAWIRLVEGAP